MNGVAKATPSHPKSNPNPDPNSDPNSDPNLDPNSDPNADPIQTPALVGGDFGRGGFRVSRQACGRHHFDGRVVVGHAAWVEPPGGNQHIDLRPVCLDASRLDAINAHAPVEHAKIIAQDDRVAVL